MFKKRSYLFGFLIIIFCIVIGFFLYKKVINPIPSSFTAIITSPQAGQIVNTKEATTISWKITPPFKGFVIVYLFTSDDKGKGVIKGLNNNESQLIWNRGTFHVGDIGNLAEPGKYKIKIIGYKELFCDNGECSPDAKTSSLELFEATSGVFELKD